MLNLVTAASFVLSACLVWLFARMVFKLQENPIRQRLASSGTPRAFPAAGPESAGSRLVESLADQIPPTPLENGELEKDLRRAGYYKPTARREFLAIRNALVILAVVAAGTIAVVVGPDRKDLVVRILVGGLVATIVCWAVPRVLLAMKAKRRMERIRSGVPNALDMVSMCMAGGLQLQDALVHVSREIFDAHPDLAVELSIVRQQAEMNTLAFAFQQFAWRIDLPETSALASLISQTQRLGTSVADAIRQYADDLRLKRRQEADEQSGKAQWKMLFPVIFCLVPSVLLLLWGPAILEMWKFFRESHVIVPPGL